MSLQGWGCKGLPAVRNSHLRKSSYGRQENGWIFPLVLLGLPIAILLHEWSALFIVLIHQGLDQRSIRKSSTCTARLTWIYYPVWIPVRWCSSWTGNMTVTVPILRGFQRIWQHSHPDLVEQPVLPWGEPEDVPSYQRCWDPMQTPSDSKYPILDLSRSPSGLTTCPCILLWKAAVRQCHILLCRVHYKGELLSHSLGAVSVNFLSELELFVV